MLTAGILPIYYRFSPDNYFLNRATNASAESLNSKIKQFRAQLRGVIDVDFFLYRLSLIYG